MKPIMIVMSTLIVLFHYTLIAQSSLLDETISEKLPGGEYRIRFKGFLACGLSGSIQNNFYLVKTTGNEAVIRGNITQKVLFDDTFHMNVMISAKDSNGGWQDNALVFKTPKGCSALKYYLGSQWNVFFKSFGYKDPSCPLPPGTWVTKGYNTSIFLHGSNFPKSFYYGTYKFKLYFTDKHNSVQGGCSTYVVDIVRPWEVE